ncbi:MAG: hypothetical protein ACYTG7_23705 [Planctomycetota bacterium]|jgi:hypothetical protein
MKTSAMSSMIMLVVLSLLAAGCASSMSKNQLEDEDIKTLVMSRYDGFAKSGGKACDE